MSQIAHSFSEQTTRQTVVGTTYTSVLSHASGNFTAGGKYLLMVTALTDGPNSSDDIRMRVAHGGTAFADSEYILEPTNSTKRYNYVWFKVWTAVGGEAIDFQISCSNVANTVGADQITIFAMRLDVDLVENTDWFYAEVATDTALSTTPLTDGASVTFTPVVSTNWLILTTAQLQVSSLVVNYASQIVSSGTYSDTLPKRSREGEDNNEKLLSTLGRVFEDLGAVSQTFQEQSFNEVGISGTRLHSAIFALNLNKFRQRAHIWDEADEVLGTIAFDDLLGTLTINPEVAGDAWFLVGGIFDAAAAGNEVTHRLTVDEVDQPDTQTSDAYAEEEPADPIDELGIWRQTVENLSTAFPHVAAWEAEATSSSGGPSVKQKMMMVVTMELGGQVPSVATIPYEALGYVEAIATIPYEVFPLAERNFRVGTMRVGVIPGSRR